MSIQLCSGRVRRCPESFTVERDVSSAVVLLLSIVQDRDTVCQEDEGDDILGFGVVACVAVCCYLLRPMSETSGLRKMRDLLCKSRIVVVLNKVSEKRCVSAVGFDSVDHVVQIADTTARGLKGVE